MFNLHMFKPLFIAIKLILFATFVTGILYPFTITILGQIFFPGNSNGQIVVKEGRVIGSKLIGQNFMQPIYFHPHASVCNYNPLQSGASNLSIRDPNIRFASGSGLDPHITIEDAYAQIARIAKVRKIQEIEIRKLINNHSIRGLFFSNSITNVLEINLALDNLK